MPRLFISYSHSDRGFVDRLQADLDSQEVPIWIDRRELRVGDNFVARLSDGIRDSDYLGLVWSQSASESKWVETEMSSAIARENRERRTVLLPLVIDGTPLPAILESKQYADFATSYDVGLSALLSRFRVPEADLQDRTRLLTHLAKVDPNRIDPHALIMFAVSAGELEGAEELLARHTEAHPRCADALRLRFNVAISRFAKSNAPSDWLAATRIGWDACRTSHECMSNFQKMCTVAPSDRQITAEAMRLFRLLPEIELSNSWALSAAMASAIITAVHRQEHLTMDDSKTVIDACVRLLSAPQGDKRPHLVCPILHASTHMASRVENRIESRAMLRAILEAGSTALGRGGDYKEAYLHLAWAAALIDDKRAAKRLQARFREATTADEYAKAIARHPPLTR